MTSFAAWAVSPPAFAAAVSSLWSSWCSMLMASSCSGVLIRVSFPAGSARRLCVVCRFPPGDLVDGGLLVGGEDFAHDVGDLADGGVGLDGIDQGGHHVLTAGASLAQCVERGGHRLAVALPPQLPNRFLLLVFDGVVDVEDLQRRLFRVGEVVDADDDLFLRVHRALVGVGGVHDLALRESG